MSVPYVRYGIVLLLLAIPAMTCFNGLQADGIAEGKIYLFLGLGIVSGIVSMFLRDYKQKRTAVVIFGLAVTAFLVQTVLISMKLSNMGLGSLLFPLLIPGILALIAALMLWDPWW